ncbi:MAG: hypothetical protein VX901_13940 [Candidatus Poribacteria bacterium]|nr:hypothetical protein [Candidatus Poribacteria bacterium]
MLDTESQIEIADQVVEIALEQQKALDNDNLDDFIELGRDRGDLIQCLNTMQNSARAGLDIVINGIDTINMMGLEGKLAELEEKMSRIIEIDRVNEKVIHAKIGVVNPDSEFSSVLGEHAHDKYNKTRDTDQEILSQTRRSKYVDSKG